MLTADLLFIAGERSGVMALVCPVLWLRSVGDCWRGPAAHVCHYTLPYAAVQVSMALPQGNLT